MEAASRPLGSTGELKNPSYLPGPQQGTTLGMNTVQPFVRRPEALRADLRTNLTQKSAPSTDSALRPQRTGAPGSPRSGGSPPKPVPRSRPGSPSHAPSLRPSPGSCLGTNRNWSRGRDASPTARVTLKALGPACTLVPWPSRPSAALHRGGPRARWALHWPGVGFRRGRESRKPRFLKDTRHPEDFRATS